MSDERVAGKLSDIQALWKKYEYRLQVDPIPPVNFDNDDGDENDPRSGAGIEYNLQMENNNINDFKLHGPMETF